MLYLCRLISVLFISYFIITEHVSTGGNAVASVSETSIEESFLVTFYTNF